MPPTGSHLTRGSTDPKVPLAPSKLSRSFKDAEKPYFTWEKGHL